MNKLTFWSCNWLAQKINNNIFNAYKTFITGRVIDLGCGTAPYKEEILRVADEYLGVDWKNSLHNQSNVDIIADFSFRLPIANEYADTVVSFQVIEHLPEPNFFLSECHRILKPEGKILITVPFMWHLHEAPYDYYRYTRHGLEYMLKKNGFADIVIKENTGFWQMWILKFNYHTKRFAKGPIRYVWIPIWWLGQVLAPILDRYDKNPDECASYTVIAKKKQFHEKT